MTQTLPLPLHVVEPLVPAIEGPVRLHLAVAVPKDLITKPQPEVLRLRLRTRVAAIEAPPEKTPSAISPSKVKELPHSSPGGNCRSPHPSYDSESFSSGTVEVRAVEEKKARENPVSFPNRLREVM